MTLQCEQCARFMKFLYVTQFYSPQYIASGFRNIDGDKLEMF